MTATNVGPVPAGYEVEGSYLNTELEVGDSFNYWMAMASDVGGLQQYDHYVPGPSLTDTAVFPGPPTEAPANLVVDSVTFTVSGLSVHLTWDQLTGEAVKGYTDILGYEIGYRFRDDGNWTDVSPANRGAARTYDHLLIRSQVTRGGLQYRVRATNQITELENGPQGPWSMAVSPTMVSADLNLDGWTGVDDMLILYYSLAFGDSFEVGTDRSNSTAGPLVKTLLGGLLGSTEVTDSDVLAAWDRAFLLENFGGNEIGSINANPGVDADDALILYYAAAFRDLLGDGNSGGFESMRGDLLTVPSGLTSPTDEPLKAVLRQANEFLAGQN